MYSYKIFSFLKKIKWFSLMIMLSDLACGVLSLLSSDYYRSSKTILNDMYYGSVSSCDTLQASVCCSNSHVQGCTNPRWLKFCMVAPSIWGSGVWIWLHVTHLVPRILRWLLHSWKIYVPVNVFSFRHCIHTLLCFHKTLYDSNVVFLLTSCKVAYVALLVKVTIFIHCLW